MEISESKKESKELYIYEPLAIIKELLFSIAQVFADQFGAIPSIQGLDGMQEWLETSHNYKLIYNAEIEKRLTGFSAFLWEYDSSGNVVMIPASVVNLFTENGDLDKILECTVYSKRDILWINQAVYVKATTYKYDVSAYQQVIKSYKLLENGVIVDKVNNIGATQFMEENFGLKERLIEDSQKPMQFKIPVTIESQIVGKSIESYVKSSFKPLLDLWRTLITKINNSQYKWILMKNASNNKAFAQNLLSKLNNSMTSDNMDSALLMVEGTAENIKDMLMELKPNQEQFNEHIFSIREMIQDIRNKILDPYFSTINQGRNNKQTGEIKSNNINRVSRIEREKKQKELDWRDKHCRMWAYMSNKPYTRDSIKVELDTIDMDDFNEKLNEAGNTNNLSINKKEED